MSNIPDGLLNQSPMLCGSGKDIATTSAETVAVLQQTGEFDYEIKWDGIRCYAMIDGGTVRLRTRAGEDLNARYPEVVERLQQAYAGHTVVLDGELIVLDPTTALPDFNRGQKRSSQSDPVKIAAVRITHPATFVVFDILYLDGVDYRSTQLQNRRLVLQQEWTERLIGDPRVQISLASDDGLAMWQFVRAHRLEGLIAKRRTSYYTGKRDSAWIKIKDCLRLTVIITGYEYGKGARARKVGAMYMNLLDDKGDLVPVGRVGTGLKERDHAPLMSVLPRVDDKGRILEPGDEILVEIECMPPTTSDNQLRFPSFKYVRTDVTRVECTLKQIGA